MTAWRDDDGLELERYEQHEPLRYRFEVGRRQFLAGLGGGLLVAVLAPPADGAPSRRGRGRGRGADASDELAAWLRIGADDSITVYTGKVEVGQGIRTSLAQTVAEELRVPLARIEMVMGDTALTPYDRGTHGSQSTPRMAPQLRVAAATARTVLIDLAAKRWGVAASSLAARDGEIVEQPGKRSITYGALTQGEQLSAVVDEGAATLAPDEWRVQGKPVVDVEAQALVTGRRIYVSDLALPRMQHGKILRPPSWGAKLREIDVSKAEALPGITVVRDGDFVGVVAPDPHRAEAALRAIEAQWDEARQPSSSELFEHLESHPVERKGWGGRRAHAEGSVDKGLRRARHRLSARYTVPYIAHAPLEPRAAVAAWVGDRLVVWAGTQHPFPVRDDLAQTFGLQPEQVRVRVPDTGSGYGGKHTAETAIEAARLAKGAGVPVKVVWTREEEFMWAYFRPAGVMKLRSGVDGKGKLVAWEHTNYNSGGSAIETPYEVADQRAVFQPTDSPARQGSYRALAATANCFARESHMDELAAQAGRDPLAFRRDNLGDERLRAVLDAAADRFGWDRTKASNGTGKGLAIGFDKGGYVATCVEAGVDDAGKLELVRIVTAFECGAIVNTDNLRNQVEGAVIMGLGGALWESIELDSGKVANPRFSKYRVPRITDIPPMETVLIDRKDLPSAGAGEAPIIAIAPAIANAIFDATGRRLRHLPLAPDGRIRGA